MEMNLIFLALIPGILIIVYIFRKDKVEHEPWSLIIKLLLFGALSCIHCRIARQGGALRQFWRGREADACPAQGVSWLQAARLQVQHRQAEPDQERSFCRSQG